MFKVAQFVVRHKVAAVVLIGAGVFFTMPSAEDEAATSNNPWAVQQAPAYVAAEEPGFLDKVVAEADTMLAESGMDPRETAEETVGRFDDTASSYSKANSN